MDTAGGGWALGMRSQEGGDALNYESLSGHLIRFSTTPTSLQRLWIIPSSLAKFNAFKVILVSEMLVKPKFTCRFSQLGLSRVTALLALFKSNTANLNFMLGDNTSRMKYTQINASCAFVCSTGLSTTSEQPPHTTNRHRQSHFEVSVAAPELQCVYC
jgi:hypothetical protein